MGEAHLPVVGAPEDHRPRADRVRVGGVTERGHHPAQLLVDHPVQVGVEVDVLELLPLVLERAQVGRHPHLHQLVDRGFVAQGLVDRRGQLHAEVDEPALLVPAADMLGRIAEDVVGVDQGDDQAEGLGEIGPAEPALDLARVDLVPAETEWAGVARSEVLGLGVLARVGRLPVREAVFVPQPVGIGRRPAAEHVAAGRMGQVPLALVGDLVAAAPEQVGEALGLGPQLRLVARARAGLDEAPSEVTESAAPRSVRAAHHAGQLPDDRGRVAEVGAQVGLGVGEGDAVLRGIAAGQEGRPARRAHRGVGEGAVEGEAVLLERVLVRCQVAQPPREVGPMAGIALLIGDQQEDVGGLGGRGQPLCFFAPGQPNCCSNCALLMYVPVG